MNACPPSLDPCPYWGVLFSRAYESLRRSFSKSPLRTSLCAIIGQIHETSGLETSVDRSLALVKSHGGCRLHLRWRSPIGWGHYAPDCTVFASPGGVAPPCGASPAASSRLARQRENRTLGCVQLRFLVSQPISLRACRDAHPRAECAKRTAAIAVAMARMSDKAIGDAGRVEHSETYGLRH